MQVVECGAHEAIDIFIIEVVTNVAVCQTEVLFLLLAFNSVYKQHNATYVN